MDSVTSELRFGAARLDVEQRQLLIDGQPAKLGGRAFDVLLALVERRDRAVGKNELFELVWPGVVVEENNLQVHVSALRKLLGPQVIATIPGRGYRFAAELDSSSRQTTPAKRPNAAEPPERELYGRADDLSAVIELLHKYSLVSIVGAGGIGKTRLAQAVVAAQRERSAGDVRWVELSQLSDSSLVPAAIAHAIGVRASDDRPILQTVISLLRDARALLVLDNCEHLLDAVTECASALLAESRGLKVLVTTQEALNAPDEHVYRLSGLPSESVSGTPAAVALFVARARAASPQLKVTNGHFAAITEICRRLDGLPLAIELAAARVRLLGIDGVRTRLDERFQVLTGGTRTRLRRHQTLRATLEWSHNLLSPEEQTVFRRLGVFVGGFTLDLAQAVAADDRMDEWAVLELLGHLVDKSLVVADGDEVPRYRLLETTRAFALEQLAAAGETSLLLRRHAEALLAFLQPLEAQRWTTKVADDIRFGAELDNLRAALDWAESAAGDRALACALIGSSRCIWLVHEMFNEGINRALRLLPLPAGVTPEVEARFNLLLGSLGYIGMRRECFTASLRAAELYRSLRNEPRLIDALICAAQIGPKLGEVQQVAAAIAEAEGLIGPHTPPRQAAALAVANMVNHSFLGEYGQAVKSAMRQLELYRDSGQPLGVQLAWINVAFNECGIGDFDSAITHLRSALDELRRTNAPYGVSMALRFLTFAHAMRGDREEALANGREAMPYAQRMGRGETVGMLLFIALVHARHGAGDRAAGLLGYVDSEFARMGSVYMPMFTRARDEIVERARAALGAVEFDRQMTTGAALTEEAALTLAFDEAAGRDESI